MKTKRHSLVSCISYLRDNYLFNFCSLPRKWIIFYRGKNKRDLNIFHKKNQLFSGDCLYSQFWIIIMLSDNFAIVISKSGRVIKGSYPWFSDEKADLDNWTVPNYSLGAVRIWNETQVVLQYERHYWFVFYLNQHEIEGVHNLIL